MGILDGVNYPKDIKLFDGGELTRLAADIRKFLLENVSRSGGHLASNLGVVELTIALHYCFDAPEDKIVWDVGHQSYVHKILTGRKGEFGSLRQKGGISGFTKASESVFDCFGAGHASTSVSAALGLAAARDLAGAKNKVIAVIGDGACTGGLAFEGLNNAGSDGFGASKPKPPTDLIVILNDNEMSISRNVGALSRHLNDLRTASAYLGAKEDVRSVLDRFRFGRPVSRVIERAKDKLKYMLIPGVLFEEMGFSYYGPFDGHDVEGLIKTLNKVKALNEPVLLHVYTKKGKGYRHAEENPKKFHGAAAFDTSTGNDKKKKTDGFTEIFGEEIVKIAEQNEKLVAITAAMKDGCGLSGFAEKYPERFFDVGIAEGHAAVFGAGLSAGGYLPVLSIYSTFLQRAYDNIIHDICLQKLPFVLAVDRAGAVSGDGPTHHGIFDIAFLSHIPEMTLMAPRDKTELREMLRFAALLKRPAAIRYPKENAFDLDVPRAGIEYGKAEIIKDGSGFAVIAAGTMLKTVLTACETLERRGFSSVVVNARFLKPLDCEMIDYIAQNCGLIFTVEDGVAAGGFGSLVSEYAKRHPGVRVTVFGYGDSFPGQGTRAEVLAEAGLDAESIAGRILEIVEGD